jgi:NTP pyrophosphatase (non-canonical NTP hydrolase)
MDPNEYQREALRTEKTPDFVRLPGEGPGWDPSQRDLAIARLMHGMIGVCTEAGELQDMVKKHLIYGKEFDPVNVIEECGDVLWYVALALDACGYTMTDAMDRNLAKLRARFGERFTSERALTRDLEAERTTLERAPTDRDTLSNVTRLASQVASLVDALRKSDAQRDELQRMLTACEAQRDAAQADLADTRAQVAKVRHQRDEMIRAFDEVEAQRDALAARVPLLEATVQVARGLRWVHPLDRGGYEAKFDKAVAALDEKGTP